MNKNMLMYFLVSKGLSNHDAGVMRGAVFQEIQPGAGFKTGDFVTEKLGGLLWSDSLVAWLVDWLVCSISCLCCLFRRGVGSE